MSIRLSQMTRRRGSTAMPVLAAIASFAVVLGVMYLMTQRPPSEVADVQAPTSAENVQEPVGSVADSGSSLPVTTVSSRTEIADEDDIVLDDSAEPIADEVVEQAPIRSVTLASEPAVESQDVAALVEECLKAGEFGSALDAARTVADEGERNRLLVQIAQAQIDAGEFNSALMNIKQLADASSNTARTADDASSNAPEQASLAGGGTGADFTQLIDLIMQETSGPWFDVDSVGGTMSQYDNGVIVEPNGMLRQLTRVETQGRLERLGLQVRDADLNDDMAASSQLRVVSLRQLESAVAERMADGLPVVETMKNLAGLFEVRYVFVSPEDGDILLGGPAEAWAYDEHGRPIGLESGRPMLQLDDFVTVLRTFSNSGMNQFRCSIDPRPEGMKKVAEFVAKSNARGSLRPSQTRGWVRTLQRLLGMQDIRVEGIPRDSRVAQVIVEADYRMKLIGIGKLAGVPGIESFFDLLPQNLQQDPPDMTALRWWLTMKYDSVLHSPNRMVYELTGSSVRCMSENELITSRGERVATGKAETVNRLFAEKFTEHYAELARADTTFADLQNVFDLALVAALIRSEGLDQAVNWHSGTFAPHGTYQPARFQPPAEVMSVVNHRVYNNRDIVVQVAGGVRGDLMAVVRSNETFKTSESLEVLDRDARATERPDGRWWWDISR